MRRTGHVIDNDLSIHVVCYIRIIRYTSNLRIMIVRREWIRDRLIPGIVSIHIPSERCSMFLNCNVMGNSITCPFVIRCLPHLNRCIAGSLCRNLTILQCDYILIRGIELNAHFAIIRCICRIIGKVILRCSINTIAYIEVIHI